MVGASVARAMIRAIRVLPTANDSAPWTGVSATTATGWVAAAARSPQPRSRPTPPHTRSGRQCRSARRPDTRTPAKAPAPNSASTTGTAAGAAPAVSVTSGAR